MTDTSVNISVYLEGLTPETPAPIQKLDGSLLYKFPSGYNDITVNGISISVDRTPGYTVEEVFIKTDGYGYVLIQELPEQKLYMSDGRHKATTETYEFPGQYLRNNILFGKITIV